VKLVVGLGNPGPEYEATRHNVGFLVVDRICRALRAPCSERRYHGHFGRRNDLCLLKPDTFMNRSGQAVLAAQLELQTPDDELLVVHDELDLPFGYVKLRRGGGAGGHRGIQSIQQELGRDGFFRLKVGIGKPPHGDTVDWVLEPFPPEDSKNLEIVLDYAVRAVESFVFEGPQRAMNRFNTKKSLLEAPEPPVAR
jgi:PTH1 family peptidyl-tRNA hydrolase